MFQAFIKDTDEIKQRAFQYISFGVVLFIANFFVISMALELAKDNKQQAAVYIQQTEWLAKYDGAEIDKIQKAILKPVEMKDVARVQLEQLQILENNSLEVESVRNDPFKERSGKNKSAARSVKTSLTARGGWGNIVSALNEFERHNFVVITGLDLESDSDQMVMKMEYHTYYL